MAAEEGTKLPKGKVAVDDIPSRQLLIPRAVFDVDTTKLCRLLSQMGSSLAELRENQKATKVTGAMSCDSQEAEDMRRRLHRLEKESAAAATRQDFEQLKEYVRERTKKQKHVAATTQCQMERKIDEKIGENVDKFGKWQAELMQVSSGRIEALASRLDSTESEVDDLRVVTNNKIQQGNIAAGLEKERTAQELATCNSLIYNVDSTVQTLLERIQSLERDSVEHHRITDIIDKKHDQASEQLRAMLENQDMRLKDVENRLETKISEVVEHQTRLESKIDAGIAALNAQIDDHHFILQTCVQRVNDEQLVLIQNTQGLLSNLSSRFEQRVVADDERNQKACHALEELEIRFDAARSESIALSDDVHQRAKEHFTSKLKLLEQAIEKIRERNAKEDEIGLLERLEETQAKSRDDLETLRKELLERCTSETDKLSAEFAEQQLSYHEQVNTEISERLGGVDLANLVMNVDDVNKRLENVAKHTDTVLSEVQLKMVKTQADIENVVVSAKVRQSSEEKKIPPRASSLIRGPSQAASQHVTSSAGSADSINGLHRRVTLANAALSEQKRFAKNEAHRLAQAFVDYEAMCVEKHYLISLPDEIVLAISAAAMEMAAFIAEKIDCWAVTQYINTPDVPIEESKIDAKRQEEQTSWLRTVQELVASLATSLGIGDTALRSQARDWILARIAKTLDFCLSKYDSTVVIQRSGLSTREKELPIGIASDSPSPYSRDSNAGSRTFADDANRSNLKSSGDSAERGGSDRQTLKKDEAESTSSKDMPATCSKEKREAELHLEEQDQNDPGEIDSTQHEVKERQREHSIERWCAEWN